MIAAFSEPYIFLLSYEHYPCWNLPKLFYSILLVYEDIFYQDIVLITGVLPECIANSFS
jgi:hypothetical protein